MGNDLISSRSHGWLPMCQKWSCRLSNFLRSLIFVVVNTFFFLSSGKSFSHPKLWSTTSWSWVSSCPANMTIFSYNHGDWCMCNLQYVRPNRHFQMTSEILMMKRFTSWLELRYTKCTATDIQRQSGSLWSNPGVILMSGNSQYLM